MARNHINCAQNENGGEKGCAGVHPANLQDVCIDKEIWDGL